MGCLTGKIALVTGGSRGIGAAIAQELAAQGASVAVTYVRDAPAAERVQAAVTELGGRCLPIRADAADAEQVRKAVQSTREHFGRLDILVNNAGIFRAAGVEELTLDDFDATMAVNVRSAFVASQAAAALMGHGGRIISIGSSLAVRSPSPGLSVYSASKAAITAMSQGLARDLGPRGITVNVVHPGSTDTDMNPASGPHAQNQKALMAGGGFAKPGEIAAVVAFLASPAAQSVTGAAWTIDNGANA